MPGTTTDTVPAMLTPGEFVIKRESAKMLGLPFLRKLNAVSDNAAHENMDALIAQAELSNMKPMLNGGEVVSGYKKGDVVKPMSAGIIANLLSMASSKYRPEANERLTPEEEILLELLNQSDKAEASVSPPMLGEVNLNDFLKVNEEDFSNKLKPVYEAINIVSKDKLINEKDLFGFIGAPWTIFVYMLNKKSPKNDLSKDFYKDKYLLKQLIKIIEKFLKLFTFFAIIWFFGDLKLISFMLGVNII